MFGKTPSVARSAAAPPKSKVLGLSIGVVLMTWEEDLLRGLDLVVCIVTDR